MSDQWTNERMLELSTRVYEELLHHSAKFGNMPKRYPLDDDEYHALAEWMRKQAVMSGILWIAQEQADAGYPNFLFFNVAMYPKSIRDVR